MIYQQKIIVWLHTEASSLEEAKQKFDLSESLLMGLNHEFQDSASGVLDVESQDFSIFSSKTGEADTWTDENGNPARDGEVY